jgi:hypothetical protein
MLEIKQVAKRRESSSEVERFMQRLKKAALHCKAIVDFPTDSRINTSR